MDQPGIFLGLNGMAVGGKRRFTIAPKLVCGWADWGGRKEADHHGSCLLAQSGVRGKDGTVVRIEALQVEATLTGACAPLSRVGRRSEDICRDMDLPKREPEDPIWRFYYAEPLPPRSSQ